MCQNMGRRKKWAAWNHVIFLCKPCCWYLICSILSSSFKSPPTPSDPQPWPYLNLPLLPVQHISNANYLNLSVHSIPHIHQLVIQISPHPALSTSLAPVKRCLTEGWIRAVIFRQRIILLLPDSSGFLLFSWPSHFLLFLYTVTQTLPYCFEIKRFIWRNGIQLCNKSTVCCIKSSTIQQWQH